MILNILAGWFEFPPGEGAFYAVFGFFFVFFGIALLIAIFTLLGAVMKRINGRKRKESEPRESVVVQTKEEELSPELIAVLSAAIAAYYEGTGGKCDFVVRRIKKL